MSKAKEGIWTSAEIAEPQKTWENRIRDVTRTAMGRFAHNCKHVM